VHRRTPPSGAPATSTRGQEALVENSTTSSVPNFADHGPDARADSRTRFSRTLPGDACGYFRAVSPWSTVQDLSGLRGRRLRFGPVAGDS
jgi:hypothetical protein